MPSLGPVELLIIVVFALVIGAVVLGFVATTVLAVRNARVVRSAGLDPTTLQADLAVRATQSLTPRTLEERLRELDDLRARGVISEQEHAAARSRALGG